MAIVFKLAGVNFASTIPKTLADPIMGAGSLMLLDCQAAPPSSLVLGGVWPNIAWETAQPLIAGSSDQASLSPAMARSAAHSPASQMTIEASGKGGVHFINTQVPFTQLGANEFVGWEGPTNIRDYVHANPTHKFFYSVWGVVTRLALTKEAGFCQISSNALQGSNYVTVVHGGLTRVASGGSKRGEVTDAPRPLGAFIKNVGTNGVVGVLSGGNNLQLVAGRGMLGWAGITRAKEHSWICYRSYLEDLTVSGRTYAEADAIDYALYQEAMASRFAGDTWRDPATALP